MAIAISSPTLLPAVDALVSLCFMSRSAFMQMFRFQLAGDGGQEYPELCRCLPASTDCVLLSPATRNTTLHRSPLPRQAQERG